MNLKSLLSAPLLLVAFSALPAKAYSVHCDLLERDPRDFSLPGPVGRCRMTYAPSEVEDPPPDGPEGAFDAGGECTPGNRDGMVGAPPLGLGCRMFS